MNPQHTPKHRQPVPSPRKPERPQVVGKHRRDMGPTLSDRLRSA